MKKFYSLLFCLGLAFSVYAQNSPFKLSKEELRIEQMPSKIIKKQQRKQIAPLPQLPRLDSNVDIVTIIDLDTVANAYVFGSGGNKFSHFWVDPSLNTVTTCYKMSPGIGYHISKDGGITWEHNIPLIDYNTLGDSILLSRSINHAIHNPAGNQDPGNAYVSYITPAEINSEWPYDSYLHGLGKIGDTSYHPYAVLPKNDRFRPYSPSGYDLTSAGDVFLLDAKIDWVESVAYYDSLIITKGTWDEDQENFVYERENLEALVSEESTIPVDYKIAFGPDGQTGYIVMLADNNEADQVEGFQNYYPIYWKTTNAGETWDGPQFIQLDGPNGLPYLINNHLTDSQIEELFPPPAPERDEISYSTGYDCDIVVDKFDNLHIAVVIAPTGAAPYSIITAEGFFAAYNLITPDGGTSWYCREMGRLRTFRGTFGDLTDDNRIQLTITNEGNMTFTTWLDTDLEEEEDNNRPNIWARGNDVENDCKTWNPYGDYAPTNVTENSDAMWQAYFYLAPKYCFIPEEDHFNIPFVYLKIDPTDPLQPAIIKYITDFEFTEDDFLPCTAGTDNVISTIQGFNVNGNHPNPFKNETTIKIELYRTEDVELRINSITGQELLEKDFGKLNQGKHDLKLTLNDLSSGIYFYTVKAGNERLTRKMIVD